jgi:hypothetical protein
MKKRLNKNKKIKKMQKSEEIILHFEKIALN